MLVSTQVKYIQSLGHKKFRDADGVFVAEGPKIVLELIQSENCNLVQCFATEGWLRSNEMNLKGSEHLVVEVRERELERISGLVTPNQVLGIFAKPVFRRKSESEGLILLLDNIQDPGNLGTIIRIADWFGVKFIAATTDTADVFNPKVVQSAMGSLIRVEMKYTDPLEFLRSNRNLPILASSLNGDDLNHNIPLTQGILILGNESRGISPLLEKMATRRIRIPKYGGAESLNVSVAAGIILSRLATPSQKQ
jgi:RNA methyltransferase, TrmH family